MSTVNLIVEGKFFSMKFYVKVVPCMAAKEISLDFRFSDVEAH